MSGAVEQAAEIIKAADVGPDGLGGDLLRDECCHIAQALADAGLLVTDEIQAVLDTVVYFHDWCRFADVVDAYLASEGEQ